MPQIRTYKVGREGALIGTFDEPEIVYLISCGKIVSSDDYWTDGMPAWQKISTKAVWKISESSPGPSPHPYKNPEPTLPDSESPETRRRRFASGTFISYPDDPTHGMDPEQKSMFELIQRLNAKEGKTQ
jgi:hypothetical protein